MADKRRLHLNINILNSGFHGAAWRAPNGVPNAFLSIDHYVRIGQLAERGTFDAVFLADGLSVTDTPDFRPFQALEPTIVLAAIAAHTTHIGLIATVSSTFSDPYNLARRLSSLDIVSGGRTGWNVVTTAENLAARNFGLDNVLQHDDRYARAHEFTDVVKALWDSWEEDALVADKRDTLFLDRSRLHAINHEGRFYKVAGPLNVPGSSRQGRPVIVQAGGSDDGRELAGAHAEAIFSVARSKEEGLAFATDVRTRAARYGRDPNEIVFLPGLSTIIGSTEAEAKRRDDELWELLSLDFAVARLAGSLGLPADRLALDKPLPDDAAVPANGSQTFSLTGLETARREGLTVRQLLRRLGGGTGHRQIVGSPEQVADDIADWFEAGVADGFNLMPDVLPDGLEIFVDEVVPLLRRKGIFRETYEGSTLRDHFGLARPANRFSATRSAAE